jgi:hypothetical protein
MSTASRVLGTWTVICVVIFFGAGLVFHNPSVAVRLGLGGLVTGLLMDWVAGARAKELRAQESSRR